MSSQKQATILPVDERSSNHYIAINAMSITTNALGDAHKLSVSIASGSIIKVYYNEIAFFNTGNTGELKSWILRSGSGSANVYIGNPTASNFGKTLYMYARINESSAYAELIFSIVPPTKKYGEDHGTTAEDIAAIEAEGGSGYYVAGDDANNVTTHHILLGVLSYSASDGYTLTYDPGKLGTYQNTIDLSGNSNIFDMEVVDTDAATIDYYIVPKYSFKQIVVAKTLSILNGCTLKLFGYDITKMFSSLTDSNDVDSEDDAKALTTANWVKKWVAKHFLRRDKDDATEYNLGMKSASVTQKVSITAGDSNGDILQLGAALNRGVQGGGAYKDASGNIHFEADYIDVHKKFSAKEVEVQELSYIGGVLVLTPADGFKVVKVRRLAANENILDGDSGTAVYYDLLWYAEEDGRTIFNQWKEGDRAMCQVFSSYANENTDIGKYGSGINTKFYWCHVKAADTITIDSVNYNYIRISYKNGECATGSNPPSVGDSVVMLGHYLSGEDATTAKARQSAITQAAAGGASPYIRIYEGIGADGSFTMPTAIGTQLKPGANKFTGEVNISGGTIQKADGSTTNFNDFITNMLEAAANGNEALETVSNMKFSLSNLLRNSGFAGDYVSDVVTETSEMSGDESIFSPSMDRWDYDPSMVSAVSNSGVPADDKFDTTSGLGESGMMCRMVGTTASITQVLTWKTTNEKYTFSLYAKRRSEATGNNNIVVSFSNGTSTFDTTITLKSTWDRYNFSFENKAGFTSITISGDAYITQLQLEKNGLSGWGLCVLDNTSEMSMYNALKYLSTQLVNYAVNDGDTYINGGLILSSLIQLGSNNADNTAWECRSGLNGIVVTDKQMDRDTSPAFWAGGDLTAACLLSRYYKDVDISSIEKPSSSLAAQMARAVITHGGRAILRDAVVQGKVYADSGEFRGTVYAQDGEFSGTVKANMMYQKTMQITAQKYVIDPSVEPCTTYYYMPGNENKDYTIILPMAKDYDGLEINVSIFSTLDTPNKYYVRTLYQDDAESLGTSNIDYSDYFLYYKNNASTIDGTIVEKMNVNYSRVHGQKIQMHTSSYFTFKSIGGSWYAIRGLFLSVV